eukprot:12773023-Alexandrium_andersonii.AAC.1
MRVPERAHAHTRAHLSTCTRMNALAHAVHAHVCNGAKRRTNLSASEPHTSSQPTSHTTTKPAS